MNKWKYGPASLCRMNADLLRSFGQREEQWRVIAGACATILIGTAAYGYAFGAWRSNEQGLYSAAKMPLLFLSIVLTTGLINTMLAQLMGSGLSFGSVCRAFLLSMAITSAILGALSPVSLFLVFQVPSPDPAAVGLDPGNPAAAPSMRLYWMLLLYHVAIIGFAGFVGNIRLYRYLKYLTGTRRMAVRLLCTWILITGFVGCELSWLFSPFLCKPTRLPHIIPKEYFQENFYERVWRAAGELAMGADTHGRGH